MKPALAGISWHHPGRSVLSRGAALHLGSGTSFCLRFVGLGLLVLIFYFLMYFVGKAEGTHMLLSDHQCLGAAYSFFCFGYWAHLAGTVPVLCPV